jgi:uncharacterized protein (TIGR00369 family)
MPVARTAGYAEIEAQMSVTEPTQSAIEPEAPWREPVRGGYPHPGLFSLPGLERLLSLRDGRTPRPPLQRLTGLRLTEVGEGTAVFELPLSPWLRSSQGPISIGPLSIPADAALGCAVQTVLPAGTGFTTSELSLRLLSPAQAGGLAVARARIVRCGPQLALAEATVTDEHGRLLAHGSSLLVAISSGSLAPPASEAPVRSTREAFEGPDPWQRPAQGAVLEQGTWDRLNGLEVLRAQLSGELPEAPISRLTGLRLTAVADGTAEFAMPASEWLCAPPGGRAQGGTVALLGEAAIGAAIQTQLTPGTALGLVDLKVNFLRPLDTDGREAVARGRVVHAGRRIAVANAEVLDAAGKPVALATGSAMLLPARPASLSDG